MNENKPDQANLLELFQNETSLDRYRRSTVGPQTTIPDLVAQELCTTFLSWIPGAVGIILRRTIYSLIYKNVSHSAIIGTNCTLRCLKKIHLSSNVVIDDYVHLTADSSTTPSISIGENSFIRPFASLNAGPPNGSISIGANSSIGQGTVIYGNGKVTIGDNVMIAGQCFIVASSHIFEKSDIPKRLQGITLKGISIGDDVWIGAGAKILDGVSIGEGSIIGANTVVTKNIPPHSKAVGIPAKYVPL